MPVYSIQPDRVVEEFARSLRWRAMLALTVLAGIIVVSTAVMVFFAPRGGTLDKRILLGLWDTLQLISTVGAFNDDDLAVWQRVWALLVIMLGLGAVLMAFGTLQSLLQSGEIRRLYVRRKMQRTLNNLHDHIIICGYGTVGRKVAEDLKRASRPMLVIDQSDEAVADADKEGHLAIHADCASEQTLRDAGLERAAGLIAALNNDATNVFLILIAREIRPDLRIVTRADRDETRSTLLRAGANRVIVPSEIAGAQLSHLILKPRVSEFIASATGEGEYEFVELEVASFPSVAGKTLRQLDLPRKTGAIVISIIDGEGKHSFSPPADRTIEPTDTLIIVCQEGGVDRIEGLE
ncbi:MAG: TrkA family potassium uptake protein [Phycisphaerales bacterium]|nr:MAG: TrkA family potassium uptake protein [Phycisphaerales bacterium]